MAAEFEESQVWRWGNAEAGAGTVAAGAGSSMLSGEDLPWDGDAEAGDEEVMNDLSEPDLGGSDAPLPGDIDLLDF